MANSPTLPALDVLLPGDPKTQTGGYIYDKHIGDGLGRLGWTINVHSLDSSFPQPTAGALQHARTVLSRISSGCIVAIDGLALGGLSKVLEAEAKRLRLVALIHHPLALETGLDAEIADMLRESERASLELVERVVVTSPWTARALGGYGVTSDRIRVVEPGIDDALQGYSPRDARGESLKLLCVATLTPRKGHTVMFDALARLRNRPWHLYCAGSLDRDPATAEALNRQIDRLGLRARISLLGEVQPAELKRYYDQCDLFVLASYMEGYGMALAEAVSHGMPVISTLAGAIPETVPANAGLLVPPGDEEALAEALARVMDDPETRSKLTFNAMAARKRARTWSHAATEFAAALQDLLVNAGREP